MKLRGKDLAQDQNVNVLSLFGQVSHDFIQSDPLEELLDQTQVCEEVITFQQVQATKAVSEDAFPDQSLLILEEQLLELRSRLGRLKFYLDEVNELIPTKNI